MIPSVLLSSVAHLYFIIFCGFIVGKLGVKSTSVGHILVNFFAPMVVFYAISSIELSWQVIVIPFVIIAMMTLILYISFYLIKQFTTIQNTYLFTFLHISKNGGYLGIVIAYMLFDTNTFNIYILTILGYHLQLNGFAMYFFGGKQEIFSSWRYRLSKITILYVSLFALFLNYMDIEMPEIIWYFREYIFSSYMFLGICMIGVSLAEFFGKYQWNRQFIFIPMFVHYLLWPFLMSLVIYIDKTFIHFFYTDIYRVLLLFSVMPVGANVLILTAKYGYKIPEVSLSLFINNILAIIYLPILIYILGIYQ